MRTSRYVIVPALLAVIAPLCLGMVWAQQASQPLTEAKIARMLELKIKGEVITSLIQKQGIDFAADEAALERLKQAGAVEVVLDAVRQAGAPKPTPTTTTDKPVKYQDVVELLNLGIPEPEIIDRLRRSPTAFTLDQGQVAELKRLGATEALLGVMQAVKTQVGAAGELSNLAITFDCSGSMSERTREGHTKMEAARQAAIKLVQEVPEGVRLAFVIYGHDRALECNAVRVSRPLVPLDERGRATLIRLIGQLKPVGSTPIALALRTAGRELAKARGPSGLILISDGKEMCGGNPASEATALTQNLKLDFGVQVVGFGVKDDERQALAEIAEAGKGEYHDAPTPEALRDVISLISKRVVDEAKPAPPAEPVPVVTDPAVQALIGQLNDEDWNSREQAAEGLGKLGDKAAVPALMKRVADETMRLGLDHDKNAALEALKRLAPDRVQKALITATKSKNAAVRAWAAKRLAEQGSLENAPAADSIPTGVNPAVQALIGQLNDEDWNSREQAAEGLGKLGDKAAVPALMKRVADETMRLGLDHDKNAALEALKRLAPDRVQKALITATKSKNAAVRAWATKRLAEARVKP